MTGDDPLTVVFCGGGNGSHVAAAFAKQRPNTTVRVFSLFKDEAARWTEAMKKKELLVTGKDGEGKNINIKAKPDLITKDPKEAITGAQLIVLVVPAFAHEGYFTAMKPYITAGTVIAAIPGASGFEFQARSILGHISKDVTLMNFITLPWNCRIQEYGTHVFVMSIKNVLDGGILEGATTPKVKPVESLQGVLGPYPKLLAESHLLAASLSYTNTIIHPTIMYGTWGDWDGKALDEAPLFYQGINEKVAKLLSDVSDEVVNIGKSIEKQRPECKMACLRHLSQVMIEFYGDQIQDKSNLYKIMSSNKGFEGLRHPMVESGDGKFSPDFNYRYLVEDIPFGVSVVKGIAEIVGGVETPTLDKILIWGQSKLGQEILVNGKIAGKDLNTTRAPQRFGFSTLDGIVSGKCDK